MNKYTYAVVISAGSTGLSAVQTLLSEMQHFLSNRVRLVCCYTDDARATRSRRNGISGSVGTASSSRAAR